MTNMIRKIVKTEGIKILIPIFFNGIKYVFLRYILNEDYITKRIHGSKMQLNLKDNGIARALAILGTREKEHLYILKRELKNNMNVLDVGANIGYYTLIMKRLIGNGIVYAIEPCPINFTNLVDNIHLNKYDDINYFNLAISDKEGEAKLHLSNLSNVHTMLPNDVANQMNGTSIKVKTVTPTIFMKNIKKPIHLIRMDIEGYETKVLKDIADNSIVYPMILFEVHAGKYTKNNNLNIELKKLFKLGYYFKYMASSNNHIFGNYGYTYIKKIPTDGTVRHIYKNIKNEDGLKLINECRTVLLSKKIKKEQLEENCEEFGFCPI